MLTYFKSLLLVGGFAESKYLRAALDERLKVRGVKQISIDEPTYVSPAFISRGTGLTSLQ